jgi:hypothetical protein
LCGNKRFIIPWWENCVHSVPTDRHLGSTAAQNLGWPRHICTRSVTQLQPLYPVMKSFKWNKLEHFVLVMCLDQSGCLPAKSVHGIYSFHVISSKHFKHWQEWIVETYIHHRSKV